MKKISLVVPVFNEEKSIKIFVDSCKFFFEKNLDINKYKYEIVFINDGSKDTTLLILERLIKTHPNIIAINLSRNFGKENALFCGLNIADGNIIIPIDVDLQDPLEVIPSMLEKYEEGYEVVLAKRADRDSDSFFKKKTASLFYNFYNKIADVKLESNVGDFRLMDRQVVDEIIKLKENQLFMKGLFSWVGFNYTIVEYERKKRAAGTTKFNFLKLFKLAKEGFTSFSTLPLKMWSSIGIVIAFLSFIFSLKIIIEKLFFGIEEHGYASIICAVTFIGGIQLISIGVLGEYIGRIYLETKQRPKYIIKKIIRHEN